MTTTEWSCSPSGRCRVAAGRWPLYVDYVKNDTAIDNGLDTAYSTGILYGKASDPRTWEIGYFYQMVEKDALFGAVHRFGLGRAATPTPRAACSSSAYALAKNWTLNTGTTS